MPPSPSMMTNPTPPFPPAVMVQGPYQPSRVERRPNTPVPPMTTNQTPSTLPSIVVNSPSHLSRAEQKHPIHPSSADMRQPLYSTGPIQFLPLPSTPNAFFGPLDSFPGWEEPSFHVYSPTPQMSRDSRPTPNRTAVNTPSSFSQSHHQTMERGYSSNQTHASQSHGYSSRDGVHSASQIHVQQASMGHTFVTKRMDHTQDLSNVSKEISEQPKGAPPEGAYHDREIKDVSLTPFLF